MPFLNNAADAAAVTYPALAAPQSGDLEILLDGFDETGVVSGCAVTYGGSGRDLAVAAGVVRVSGRRVVVTGGTVTPGAGDGSNPRWDLVVVNTGGTKSVTAGTAAATPTHPAIPANSAVLAAVWVPTGATTLAAANIQDKRVVVPDAVLFDVTDYGAVAEALLDSGTSTGSNSATTLNDTGKTWVADAYNGKYVAITGGAAVGSVRLILDTLPTQLVLDNTTLYSGTAEVATDFNTNSLYDAQGTGWTTYQWACHCVETTGGTGSGQKRNIVYNDAYLGTQPYLRIGAAWTTVPDATTAFRISQQWATTPDATSTYEVFTDQSAAIQAAIDAAEAAGSGTVFLPFSTTGTYRLARALVVDAGSLTVDGAAGVTLWGSWENVDSESPSYTWPLLLVTGAITLLQTYATATIARAARSLVVNSATGLAAGDHIRIRSTTQLFNPSRTTYYKGEIQRIESMAGTTVNLDGQTWDAYTYAAANDIMVEEIAMLDGPVVRTLAFQGVGTGNGATHQVGVLFRYCLNARAEHLRVDDTEYAGVMLGNCLDFAVVGCTVVDVNESITKGASVGLGYGVLPYGSSRGVIERCTAIRCRHGFDAEGHTPYGVCRHITYANNIAISCSSSGVSEHGNSEYLTFIGNHILFCGGGITVRGQYITAQANKIYGFVDSSDDVACGFAIGDFTTNELTSGLAGTGLKVLDNEVHLLNPYGGTPSVYGMQIWSTLNGAVIRGNNFSGHTAPWIRAVSYNIFDSEIDNNTVDCASMPNSSGVEVIRILQNAAADGRYQRGLSITRNRFLNNPANNPIIDITGNSANTAANLSRDILIAWNFVEQNNPKFVDLSGGWFGKNVSIVDNFIPTITMAQALTRVAGQMVNPVEFTRNKTSEGLNGIVGQGTTPPTAEAYEAGNIWLNTATASLGVLGWVCTVAGSPGTWETLPLGAEATVATTTLASSTTETNIFVQSIPASSWRVGKALRINVRGVYGTHTTGTNQLTLRVRIGGVAGTLIVDTGTNTMTNSLTNRGWQLDVILVCRTTGASGTIMAQGFATFNTTAIAGQTVDMEKTATVTRDTTVTADLVVTAQWSVNNAANTISAHLAQVEALN